MTPVAIDTVRGLVVAHLADGRRLGAHIDRDPAAVAELAHVPLGIAMNALGMPDSRTGLVERCAFYEALGYVDPNLAFAAPGPGMAGFVVSALGDDRQKDRFFQHFAEAPAWSCFALTERESGTDAGNIALRAVPIKGGGYRLRGEKYLIGQGWRADVGVVFARLAEGPLGIGVFLIEPGNLSGYSARRLPMVGCRGANLSHLILEDVELPEDALLGAHLRPTQRIRASASATFDALRPCVGAVALGLARGVLDRAEAAGIAAAAHLVPARLELMSLFSHAIALCRAADAGGRPSRAAGFAKAQAAGVADRVIADVIAKAPAGAVAAHSWLAKAWRDVRAFEYAEGVSSLHRLNAAELFRETGHAMVH